MPHTRVTVQQSTQCLHQARQGASPAGAAALQGQLLKRCSAPTAAKTPDGSVLCSSGAQGVVGPS